MSFYGGRKNKLTSYNVRCFICKQGYDRKEMVYWHGKGKYLCKDCQKELTSKRGKPGQLVISKDLTRWVE